MSEAALIPEAIKPFLQGGIVGMLILYVFYTDWTARKENRRIENERIKREAQREQTRREDEQARREEEQVRERDCVKRIRDLEIYQKTELAKLIKENNMVSLKLISYFSSKAPTQEIVLTSVEQERLKHGSID